MRGSDCLAKYRVKEKELESARADTCSVLAQLRRHHALIEQTGRRAGGSCDAYPNTMRDHSKAFEAEDLGTELSKS